MESDFSSFTRIAIVGVGLIGGSLGLAWRHRGLDAELVGIDLSEENLHLALERGAIDRGVTDFREGVAGADLVVLCTPIRAMLEIASELSSLLAPGTVVTDVGSTKRVITEHMEKVLPDGVYFVGGHPMAGSEQAGIRAADPFLFENAVYILTPGTKTMPAVTRSVAELLSLTGCEVIYMSAAEHDLCVAAVSHLPQIVAVSLARTVGDMDGEVGGILRLAAGGFRDTTRVAASPPMMWQDICVTNRDMILQVLGKYREALGRLERFVAEGDTTFLAEEFRCARRVREAIPSGRKGIFPESFELVVRVKDVPGVIGEITSTLGEARVSITDIEILRLREGEGGVIRLAFKSAAERAQAEDVLSRAGFGISRRG